jgi:hypothetical protein
MLMKTRMNTERLDAAIDAACRVCKSDEVIVVGPAALCASVPESVLRRVRLPRQVDMLVPLLAEYSYRADDVLTQLGAQSRFQAREHVVVNPLDAEDVHLPSGWHERLVRRPTGLGVGLCADAHDVCATLLAANEPGSRELVENLVRAGVLDPVLLQRRVQLVSLHDPDAATNEGHISTSLSLMYATRAAEKLQHYVATLLPTGRR